MQRVMESAINGSCFFPKTKLTTRVLPWVFEPNENGPCIDEGSPSLVYIDDDFYSLLFGK
jgi:hypothetical protein